MEDTNSREERGWVWATFFVVMGVVYISDGLRDPHAELYRLIMGAGFLLAAPQALFSPVNFAKPTLGLTKVTPVDWVGMVGVLLLIAGLVVRLL